MKGEKEDDDLDSTDDVVRNKAGGEPQLTVRKLKLQCSGIFGAKGVPCREFQWLGIHQKVLVLSVHYARFYCNFMRVQVLFNYLLYDSFPNECL